MYTLPIMFALWCSICTSWKKDFFTEKSETTDQPSAPMILFKSVGRDLCVEFSYLQFIIKFKFVYELHVPVKSVCFSHVGVKCSDTRSAHTGECRSAIWLKPKSWLIDIIEDGRLSKGRHMPSSFIEQHYWPTVSSFQGSWIPTCCFHPR